VTWLRTTRRADERDPVRVVVGFSGSLVHEGSDGVVVEEEAVEFLLGAIGVLESQDELHLAVTTAQACSLSRWH
jgi:hypothetical protein